MLASRALRASARAVVLLLVGWGITASVRKASQQLEEQRLTLEKKAAALELRAREQSDPVAAASLLEEADFFRRQGRDFWKVDGRFLLLGGLLYAASLFPAALFWHHCLRALSLGVDFRNTARAYFYGNLGKYVPGKIMVFVLRMACLRGFRLPGRVVALTIFFETLTMMAVGSAWAALSLALLNLDLRLTGLASLAFLGFLVPIYPPLLRRILLRLQSGEDAAELQGWANRLDGRLVARGALIHSLTWLGFGFSLGMVLMGLPCADPQPPTGVKFWLSVQAACAAAVVLGFASMVPGGAGVREVVLSAVLTPVVGAVAALSSAIWLRLLWLAVELLLAALFSLSRRL